MAYYLETTIGDANPKVASLSANVVLLFLAALPPLAAEAYASGLLPPLTARLGDGKESVRQAALDALLGMVAYKSPRLVFTAVIDAIKANTRSWHVREEGMRLLVLVVAAHGPAAVDFAAAFPVVLENCAHSHPAVREMAALALETLYRYWGNSLLTQLADTGLIGSSIKSSLTERLASVELHPDASLHQSAAPNTPMRDARSQRKSSGGFTPSLSRSLRTKRKRRSSASRKPGCSESSSRPGSSSSATSPRAASDRALSASTSPASVSSETSESAAPVRVGSDRELASIFDAIRTPLLDAKTAAWTDRVAALVKLQGLVVGGAAQYPSFHSGLASLRAPLTEQLSDLRSKVTKAACTTLVCLAESLGSGFESHADHFVPALFKLLPSSKAAISEPADHAIRAIIRASTLSAAIGRILAAVTGKSTVLRKYCAAYMVLLLQTYSTDELRSRGDALCSAIRAAIADALPEVRAAGRQAYWAFEAHFPSPAGRLLASLDSATQGRIADAKGDTTALRPSASSRPASTPGRARPRPGVTSSGRTGAASSSSRAVADSDGPPPRPTSKSRRRRRSMGVFAHPPPSSTAASDRGEAELVTAPGPATAAPVPQPSASRPHRASSSFPAADTPVLSYEELAARLKSNSRSSKAASSLRSKRSMSSSTRAAQAALDAAASIEDQLAQVRSRSSRRSATASGPLLSHAAASAAALPPRHQPPTEPSQAEVGTSAGPPRSSQRRQKSKRRDSYDPAAYAATPQKKEPAETKAAAVERAPSQPQPQPQAQPQSRSRSRSRSRSSLKSVKSRRASLARGLGPSGKENAAHHANSQAQAQAAALQTAGKKESGGSEKSRLGDILGRAQENEWAVRVDAFRELRAFFSDHASWLQRSSGGVGSRYERIMRVFVAKLDDPHHRVVMAAMAALGALLEAHAKPLEGWLDQVIPLLLKAKASPKTSLVAGAASLIGLMPGAFELSVLAEVMTRALGSPLPVVRTEAITWFTLRLRNARTETLKVLAEHSLCASLIEKLMPCCTEKTLTLRKSARSLMTAVSDGLDSAFSTALASLPLVLQYQVSTVLDAGVAPAVSPAHVDISSDLDDLDLDTSLSAEPETVPLPRQRAPSRGGLGRPIVAAMANKRAAPSLSGVLKALMRDVREGNHANELAQLSKMVANGSVTDSCFGQVFLVLSDVLGKTQCAETRLGAVAALHALITHCTHAFENYLNVGVQALLEAYVTGPDSGAHNVAAGVVSALNDLLAALPVARSFDVLTPLVLTSTKSSVLCLAIRLLSTAVARAAPKVLFTQLRAFLPGLLDAFQNPSTDVRKAVVFTLVEAYMVLGESLMPCLSELSSSQLKLVTIYINRRKEQSVR
ncbi:uncharacterized protein AMSG_02011 [Thecamonas trahens ATCC 50062]|uniref:TOG domain-containing protein n=1 Tax=Thecamonas trahens ATCC 50062 TaxID=461836 RepID=A0A0L0DWT2_THETB|nr:hypothetical protein AMSG_02011 [Thecamonas trahens ATCC 50062]KNC55998.1 hypothetical protein AMSG_02011 [Thecamonas trahens ATCC 50062]|eukprot:XP_013761044.1 hypothetical protein AMSG_02011 [Thecamonas trahens ATCC 50062]